jgi:Ca-activated chloride channel family protein
MTDHQRVYHLLADDARRFGGLPLWLAFRLLPGVLIGVLMALIWWPPTARAGLTEVAGDLYPGELGSGHMLLRAEPGDAYTPALIQASKVHFDISGIIATVALEQTFRNDSDRWLEGVYAFPLPDNAAVRRLEMMVGDRRIVGKIREQAAARELYRAAKTAGRKASLIEQQRPNLFTSRVANIGPGEEITVRLEYVQQVAFDAGEFALRFPTTVTPRYMPGMPPASAGDRDLPGQLAIDPYLGWAAPTDQVPDADAISPLLNPQPGDENRPLNPLEITARLDMGMPLARVAAPYHDIALTRRAGVYEIRLSTGVSEMDRDFVLNWQPVTGSAPTAALFTEEVGGEYFGLLLVLPPVIEPVQSAIPREIIFVIDTSGSMGGVSIEQARASLAAALQQLNPEDSFNIIEFNSGYRALYPAPVPASRHHIQRAREFVRLLVASGGTEMLPALRAALAPPSDAEGHGEQAPLRQVIFITDGAVGNEVALYEEVTARLGDSRLFTVGIGSAPNSWFMRKSAQFGRGSHTHIGDLGEVATRMAALFEQMARPAAVNLAVHWPQPTEVWPERLPDLYHGQPLVLAVSFGDRPPQGEVVVQGDIAGRAWRQSLRVAGGTDPLSVPRHNGVASVWARQKITGLLDQKVLGRTEQEVRAAVLPVALQHQLLSPYTSFVAVDETVSRPPGASLDGTAVANTRPLGQSPQHFAYPVTATTGPAKAWLGGLLLFLGILLRVLRQPEVDHVSTVRD